MLLVLLVGRETRAVCVRAYLSKKPRGFLLNDGSCGARCLSLVACARLLAAFAPQPARCKGPVQFSLTGLKISSKNERPIFTAALLLSHRYDAIGICWQCQK
jgi:hypothetical protein